MGVELPPAGNARHLLSRYLIGALSPKTHSMRHQIIAGIGLAAVIAFCGYMILQLDARRSQAPPSSAVATALNRL